jgi:amino acid transporter
MANEVGVQWLISPFALLLSISIAGIGSAWLAGSARIPFVAGLDSYLPEWLGKVHPRYKTPYAALIVHASVSFVLCLVYFANAGVQEAFQTMLSLAVVLQLVPFLYMFAALVRFAIGKDESGHYGRSTLLFAGLSGLLTTTLGIVLVFFPTQTIVSIVGYEIKMIVGTLFFIGTAWFLFYVYGERRKARAAHQIASRA